MVGSASPDSTNADVSGDAELERLKSENEALRTRLELRTKIRTWSASVLVILTSLSAVTATIAVWAHETVFDTDRFMAAVEPTLDDPAFYSLLSTRLSDQSLEALDLENRISDGLDELDAYISEALVDAIDPSPRAQALLSRFDRPSLAALAPGIAEALESRIAARIDGFVTSPEFEARLAQIVRQVHEGAVALVRNDRAELPNVYIEAGNVRLNLIPLIAESLRRVVDEVRAFLPDLSLPAVISDRVAQGRQQLGDALQAQLPDDFGQLTLMSEDELSELQTGAHRLDQFVWALVILTVALLALSVAVSPARRRTVVQLGIGVVIGVIVGWLLIRRLRDQILEQFTSPDGNAAARALLAEAAASLRNVALLIAIIAIAVAVVAYLAGRPRWVRSLSERVSERSSQESDGTRLERWVAVHHDPLRIAGVALAVIVLFITGIGLLSLLVIGGVLALYLWAITEAKSRHAAQSGPGDAQPQSPATGESENADAVQA